MRQGLDDAGVDGEERVEEVGELDAVSLADQTEEVAVGIEAPGGPFGRDLEPCFVRAVQQLVAGFALDVLEGQLDGAGAEPLDVDDLDGAIVADALDLGAAREVFESGGHREAFGR